MTLNERETAAALRVLVALARVDGVLHEAERRAIGTALSAVRLPEDMTLEKLLAEPVDLQKQLAVLGPSRDATRVYQAMVGFTYADGECTREERALLEEVRIGLGVSAAHAAVATSLANELESMPVPAGELATSGPEARRRAVERVVRRCAAVAAALGAHLVPVADLTVSVGMVGLHIRIIHDIGGAYGVVATPEDVRALIGGLGAGTGTRVALWGLSRVVPGWESVVHERAHFATTYAMGRVAERYYSRRGRANLDELEESFADAEREGLTVYNDNWVQIGREISAVKTRLDELALELSKGTLSAEEYLRQVAALA